MLCNTCNGRRIVIKQEPRKWYQNGTWCYLGNATVGISSPCDDCHGSGLAIDPARNPDCSWCHGTGERNAWDADEYTVEQCDCENPARQNIVEALYLNREAS